MKTMIAYCGLDCEKCDAYLATIHDDRALREKTAKLWSELNQITILPDGRKTVYCDQLCQIRRCAMKKGFETCGVCPDMETCPTVATVISNNAAARKNLKG